MIAKKSYSIPFIIWIIAGTIIPLASIAYYGFTDRSGSFTFDNITAMFRGDHLQALGLSLLLAFISTAICLLLAFPMAMVLRESKYGKQGFLIFVIILPMWMNFLLRTYAWMAILSPNGFLNKLLELVGLRPLNIMPGQTAVILGMVYNFLPFMVLPIYTVLSKIDKNVLEAANDLGANAFITFIRVILPLTVPGIISGITMVFMPAVSTFVISKLLGGGKEMLIGNLIEQQFTVQRDWHFGSALSIILMIMILISMAAMSKVDTENEQGGAAMW